MKRVSYFGILIIYTFSLIFLASCSEDEDCPTCPEPLEATLANIWPNSDGNSWTYDVAQNHYHWDSPIYNTVGDVPPLPSMDDLYSELMEPLAMEPIQSLQGAMRWEFKGDITTGPGVTAQKVEITLFHEADDWAKAHVIESGDQIFLRQAMRARPDLSQAIADKFGIEALDGDKLDQNNSISNPWIFSGYAWEKNDAALVNYLESHADITWTYAEADLSLGSSFTVQPLSGLSEDCFLHGRVQGNVDLQVGDVLIENCIEMFYVFDFGAVMSLDQQGEPRGAFRGYCLGTIVFAPGIGPVSCYSRNYLVPEELAYGFASLAEHRLLYFDVTTNIE